MQFLFKGSIINWPSDFSSLFLNSQLAFLKKIAEIKSDLRLYADEIGKGLVGELDYTLEAANAAKFLVIEHFFHADFIQLYIVISILISSIIICKQLCLTLFYRKPILDIHL